jgi:hypothetical protein
MRFETRLAKAEQALGVRPDPGATARAFLQTLNDAELERAERVLAAQEAGAPLTAQQAAWWSEYQRRWTAFVQAGAGTPHECRDTP